MIYKIQSGNPVASCNPVNGFVSITNSNFMSTKTPLDLKKTINLPKTDFSQKANLAQSEPARLEKWTKLDLYRLIRQAREGREKFILHDGPPYANADIHLGTAMNKILKDFIVKSRTMMGFDAPYVPGYDCHGLPIEQHVERALEKKGKKKADLSVETFRRICREHAENALKSQTRDFKRLGILGEYLGLLLKEVKRRPVAIVRERVGVARLSPRDGLVMEAIEPEEHPRLQT